MVARLVGSVGVAELGAVARALLEMARDVGMSGRWLSRSVGRVLAQLGINATDALARIRAYAFAEQRLLSDVAHDVVSRRLHFTRDTM